MPEEQVFVTRLTSDQQNIVRSFLKNYCSNLHCLKLELQRDHLLYCAQKRGSSFREQWWKFARRIGVYPWQDRHVELQLIEQQLRNAEEVRIQIPDIEVEVVGQYICEIFDRAQPPFEKCGRSTTRLIYPGCYQHELWIDCLRVLYELNYLKRSVS